MNFGNNTLFPWLLIKDNTMLILFIVVLAIVLFTATGEKEGYSQAAMIQLYAKGPQDTYLTGDAWKHIPPIYYNYGWGPFYMPTRFGKMNYYYYRPYGLYY